MVTINLHHRWNGTATDRGHMMFSPDSPYQIVLHANKLASDKVFPILESVGIFKKHLYRRTFPMKYTLSISSN